MRYDPAVGQWNCPTCGRLHGPFFVRCGHCPLPQERHTAWLKAQEAAKKKARKK